MFSLNLPLDTQFEVTSSTTCTYSKFDKLFSNGEQNTLHSNRITTIGTHQWIDNIVPTIGTTTTLHHKTDMVSTVQPFFNSCTHKVEFIHSVDTNILNNQGDNRDLLIPENIVVNLSDYNLTESHTQILNKELNYCPTPREPDIWEQ